MSLTPASRSSEATNEALMEGLVNGFLTLCTSAGGVFFAVNNYPGFVKRTNYQSRTALIIMPALFVAYTTSENRLIEKMNQIAEETSHKSKTVKWAEQKLQTHMSQTPEVDHTMKDLHLSTLFQQSIDESGMRVVPGDTLGLHHRLANFLQANPIKTLAILALPIVGRILYANSGKQHLDMSIKLLHTRVIGQFATICFLLSVMGCKDLMDRYGTFITEAERDERIKEMKQIRRELFDILDDEKQHQVDVQSEIIAMQAQRVQNGNVSHSIHSKD